MSHPLRCRCGKLRGLVSHPEKVSRGVCYCKDCQAFAHFLGQSIDVVLGQPIDILDEMGGTDVVAALPKHVTITQGMESLACMSLSERGLLRWYASCCNTPIGNTPRNYKVSHVGLVHTCLHTPDDPARTMDASFGPVRMRVNTKSAKGHPKRMPVSTTLSIFRFMRSLVRARMDGSYKRTPFFTPKGIPVVAPKVLTLAERVRLMEVL
jgi:hypothetical protein